MQGKKILVTGPAGNLTFPIVQELVKDNEVWGLARFSDPAGRTALEDLGVTCVQRDLARDSIDDLPTDFDAVWHAGAMVAMSSEEDMAYTFEVNVQATGKLLEHCRDVKTFVHCSTGGVYAHKEGLLTEDSDYGAPIPAYSLSKIAAEQLVKYLATKHQIPTIILRIGAVYGPGLAGPMVRINRMMRGKDVWVNPAEPRKGSVMWIGDAVRMAIIAMEKGTVPLTTTNFCGDDPVSIDEYCIYAGKLLGIEPTFKWTDGTYPSNQMDTTRMHQVLGPAKVSWKEGFRMLLEGEFPDRKLATDVD